MKIVNWNESKVNLTFLIPKASANSRIWTCLLVLICLFTVMMTPQSSSIYTNFQRPYQPLLRYIIYSFMFSLSIQRKPILQCFVQGKFRILHAKLKLKKHFFMQNNEKTSRHVPRWTSRRHWPHLSFNFVNEIFFDRNWLPIQQIFRFCGERLLNFNASLDRMSQNFMVNWAASLISFGRDSCGEQWAVMGINTLALPPNNHQFQLQFNLKSIRNQSKCSRQWVLAF